LEHRIEITYTTDDDGIHLSCSCHWDKCIGYFPTVEDIMREAEKHRLIADMMVIEPQSTQNERTMSKHSKEPWFSQPGYGTIYNLSNGDTGLTMAIAVPPENRQTSGKDEDMANMARIVACVNALAGIDDPAAFVAEAKRLRRACEWRCETCGCAFPDHPTANMTEKRRKLELADAKQCTPCLVRASQAAMIATLRKQRDDLRAACEKVLEFSTIGTDEDGYSIEYIVRTVLTNTADQ